MRLKITILLPERGHALHKWLSLWTYIPNCICTLAASTNCHSCNAPNRMQSIHKSTWTENAGCVMEIWTHKNPSTRRWFKQHQGSSMDLAAFVLHFIYGFIKYWLILSNYIKMEFRYTQATTSIPLLYRTNLSILFLTKFHFRSLSPPTNRPPCVTDERKFGSGSIVV